MLLSNFIQLPKATPNAKASKTTPMNFGSALRANALNQANTEAICAETVAKDGMAIRHVKHQTPALCLLAVRQNWRALPFCKHINSCIMYTAIEQDPSAAQYCPPDLQASMMILHSECYPFLRNPSEETTLTALRYNISIFPYIQHPTDAVYDYIVHYRVTVDIMDNVFEGVPLTPQRVLRLITTVPACTRHIPKELWSQEAVSVAILTSPANIAYIPPQFQTTELCNHVFQRSPRLALQYVADKLSEETLLEVLGRDGSLLQFIPEPSVTLAAAAVRNCPAVLKYVQSHTLEVWRLAGYPHDGREPVYRFLRNVQNRTRLAPVAIQKEEDGKDKEVEDPVTLDVIPAGTVCGFLRDPKGAWHLAGTLGTLTDLAQKGFRESSFLAIFVPHRNALVSIREFAWFRLR